MLKLTGLALELLQTTQLLHDKAKAGELEAIEELQQQRATIVSELDQASRQEWPADVKAECRKLLEQSRKLEVEVVRVLNEKRDAISQEHQQLKRGRSAAKAYGKFG
ncbi:flagellar protein FliT [Marinobacterium stanieri]|uniref:flagellar protein FliT n=1 Tax=Marinobacterium stanieri TaxID=49186 RepID=UPI003A8D43AF